MKAIARQNQIAISVQKAKLVCDLVRNKSITKAVSILNNTNKKAAFFVNKLLKSAISNATNNFAMEANKLYIYEIFANRGLTLKRTFPRAKGSADMIRKRHTNLLIVLSDDPNERQNDLLKIKEKNKKRVLGQQKKRTNSQSQATVTKERQAI